MIKDEELRKSIYVDPRSCLYVEEVKSPQHGNQMVGIRFWLNVEQKTYSFSNNSTQSLFGFYKTQKKGKKHEIEYKSLTKFSDEQAIQLYQDLLNRRNTTTIDEATSENNLGVYVPIYLGSQKVERPLEEGEELLLQDYSNIELKYSKPSKDKLREVQEKLSDIAFTKEQDTKIPLYLEIEHILDGEPLQREGKHGVVLYGPPGTGKTTTMNAFKEIFKTLDFPVIHVNANSLISSAMVGAFAGKVSRLIFEPAIEEIMKSKKPCLIYVDEATSLVSKPRESNVSEWYQEGLDTIKAFLNRSRFPGIILCLATNAELHQLDETIVGGDGRLEPVHFDYLSREQFSSLWKVKLHQNLGLDDVSMFSNEQISKLSDVCAQAISGRFVANFCATYRQKFLFPNLSLKERLAMRISGRNLTKESRESQISFEAFYVHFLNALKNHIEENINTVVQKIRREHYFTLQERETREREAKEKFQYTLDKIQKGLQSMHSENSASQQVDSMTFIQEYNDQIRTFQSLISSFSAKENLETLEPIQRTLVYLQSNLAKYLQLKESKVSQQELERRNQLFQKTGEILHKILSQEKPSKDDFKHLEQFLSNLLDKKLFE